MALTTPILSGIAAFDASDEYVVKFTVIGGAQVTANRLLIKDNSTLAIVYDNTTTTYSWSHVIPAKTLTNGKVYQVEVQTISDGETSQLSTPIIFHCYTKPVLTIDNMPLNNIIKNSNFRFEFKYDQVEGELFDHYTVTLLDSSKNIVAESGVQYISSAEQPPTLFGYYFAGFNDQKQYFINCSGYTINDTYVTTGDVEFSILYETPSVYSRLYLKNDKCTGQVQATCNFIAIDGTSNPPNPIYIDKKEVDLRGDGSFVKWNENYEISEDFTMTVWLRDMNPNSKIVEISNNSGGIIRITNHIEEDMLYLDLTMVEDSVGVVYYIKTNSIPVPLPQETIFLYFRRVNNIIDLEITNIGVI